MGNSTLGENVEIVMGQSPPTKLTTSYEDTVHQLMELVLANLHENATLTCLRDTLLPTLVSGELHVPDAEKFVEEAGV